MLIFILLLPCLVLIVITFYQLWLDASQPNPDILTLLESYNDKKHD